jgi:hypothetical protein
MMGGDISAQSTPRMWVVEDVVLRREPVMPVDPPKKRWWQKSAPVVQEDAIVVNLPAMNILFRHMQRFQTSGLKLEVVHIGESSRCSELLDLLDRSGGSVFTDVVSFPTLPAMVDALPFRADVIGVVDVDDRFMGYGARGMALRDLG